MNQAEIRLLRYMNAQRSQSKWVPYRSISNTDELLPGDEKAVSGLEARGHIEKNPNQPAYRITESGTKALQRRIDYG
jgi:RIO-like serine/threonine protein kinase